ncbi:MAG: hypothetical protein ACHQAY_22830, partial [Hyphomicrobiales bacterium]
MNLVALESGQTLQLFPLEEVRPHGGFYPPGIIEAVAKRYSFADIPKDLSDAMQNGYKFGVGKMMYNNEQISIGKLDIYRDGIVVITTDTATADAVIDDLTLWATEYFKLRELITPANRKHSSGVVVDFNHSIDAAFGKAGDVASLVSQAYGLAGGFKGPLGLWRVAFMA